LKAIPHGLVAAALAILAALPTAAPASLKPDLCWRVEDVRVGMKGCGKTVMKGTTLETFQAEVLGVLMNTSPGRDLVLCRLSGLDLEKTGVIAGMSGSPVYVEGKLLGAVAYAWAYGKEPIAGITPFCQMHKYAELYEQRDLAGQNQPSRLGLRAPVWADGQRFETVTLGSFDDGPRPAAADSLWLTPLRTPVAASGFSEHSLRLLGDSLRSTGLVPVQGGSAQARVAEEAKEAKLEAGGPLAVALVTGDFDLSGIGTVTHVEGNRVYGWGHPFMGLGACEYPLMTGWIHTVYPRQTVSFKMGSPLKSVGVITADVSTGIAGWLDRTPDMLPVKMTVSRETGPAREFKVEVVRQRSLMAQLVFMSLTNSVDMEGDLPEEMTAEFEATIEVEGRPPVVVRDTYSGAGYSAGRAPAALYGQVGTILNMLGYNAHQPVRVTKVECKTQVSAGRRTAEIESVELESETLAPGEPLRATVVLKPYKGQRQRVTVELPLPADLPEGSYTATVGDGVMAARQELRDKPHLGSPQSLDQLWESLRVQTAAKRTQLALRVPTPAAGVTLTDGQPLPDLPASMVHILGHARRTGNQPMGGALVARQPTPWVVQGGEVVKFAVVKNKKVTGGE
jgi:hypothetical protein